MSKKKKRGGGGTKNLVMQQLHLSRLSGTPRGQQFSPDEIINHVIVLNLKEDFHRFQSPVKDFII